MSLILIRLHTTWSDIMNSVGVISLPPIVAEELPKLPADYPLSADQALTIARQKNLRMSRATLDRRIRKGGPHCPPVLRWGRERRFLYGAWCAWLDAELARSA